MNDDKVILFDGVCKLCNGFVKFVINNDKKRIFKLASMQSDKGQTVIKHLELSTENFETMLYIEGGVIYEKSNAFFQIIRQMPYPARIVVIFSIFPVALRDYVYDRIALNRYRLFGKHDQCMIPEDIDKDRFL